MLDTVESFIDRTQEVSSEPKLRGMFLSALKDEGYENAVFARVGSRRLTSIPWSEFPSGYLDAYKAEGWERIDPVVQKIQTARGPFRWTDTYTRNGLTKSQRAFFETCRELGVHSGITIPIHGPGAEVDLISVSLRAADRNPVARAHRAYMLSLQYWLRYCELVDHRDIAPKTLTKQELDALSWCKEGKTNWEIGEIMRISEKTVEFHLTNAMRKLSANNRMTAVITAIKAGFIAL